VDTLGAMVKHIKPNGRLRLTAIGGLPWNAVEAEGCTVFTAGGGTLRGSLMPEQASVHVYGAKVSENKRSDSLMEVRLDAQTISAEQTGALGVAVGDFVAFDPRVEVGSGFIRSRFLDDKAGVACVLAALETLLGAGLQPAQTTHALISVYEEVGHGGAAGLPADIAEMLVVDMAAIGESQNSDEQHASICVKDGFSPYDHVFSQQLRQLADRHGIPYKVDIYTDYASDGSVLWRSGIDARVALIGPGVDASHHYERTTLNALVDTARWITAYLLSEGGD
jgi:putative aminopeptidase FrvX